MDLFRSKVEDLARLKRGFFVNRPCASESDFKKDMAQRVEALLEELPLGTADCAAREYWRGKVLNLLVTPDKRAAEALDKALKLRPDEDSWTEMGNYAFEMENMDFAHNCFTEALTRRATPQTLINMARILVYQASSASQKRDSLQLIRRALEHCTTAALVDPQNQLAFMYLGNIYLLRYFRVAQITTQDLTNAIHNYDKVESCNNEELLIADYHINFAQACFMDMRYVEAEQHLRRALQIEPHLGYAKDKKADLDTFLERLSRAFDSKAIISRKKNRPMAACFGDPEYGAFLGQGMTKATVTELELGDNKDRVIGLKVLASVTVSNVVPLILVACDLMEERVAICVFNFSDKFTVHVGDVLTVPRPLLKQVLIPGRDGQLPFVVVTSPGELLRNSKPVPNSFCAASLATFLA